MSYNAWNVVFGETPSAAKWQILGDNDAAFRAGGGVQYAGISADAWSTWTPSWTNFTTGNGTLNFARYIALGKYTAWAFRYTLGSTSAVTGSVELTSPTNINSNYTDAALDTAPFIGLAKLTDTGNNIYPGVLDSHTANKFRLLAQNAASTHLISVAVSSTVPFTWGTGDVLAGWGIHETA